MFPGVTPSDLRARQADLLREESRGRPSRRPATSPRLESWFTKTIFALLTGWRILG